MVLVILAINIGIISFIFGHQTKQSSNLTTVVTNPSQLGQIGQSQGPAGQNVSLVVTPDAQFKGNVSINKGLQTSGKLTAPDASLTQLQAGSSSLSQLNVSGSSSFSDASVRGNLGVSGTATLQGAVTVAKILTAAALNVTGDLTVGGSLVTGNFSTRDLTAISNLNVGGHIVSAGSVPGWGRGGALRSTDSVSLAGNDIAGTVSYNAATGQPNQGDIISITFLTAYAATPHITLAAVSADPTCAQSLPYISGKSRSGFTVALASPANRVTGYSCQFDYEVIQ